MASNSAANHNPVSSRPVVVAISGGSGAVYARRLIQYLCQESISTHVVISSAGRQVVQQELGFDFRGDQSALARFLGLEITDLETLVVHGEMDYFTPIASGSFQTAGMVVCPCSGGTLSAIATGASRNLIQRAAEVHLKEHRKLILVPRETPLSRVALKNMLEAHDAGAVILPASPGWYHGVESLDDLVDFVVARILDQLDVPNRIVRRWSEPE